MRHLCALSAVLLLGNVWVLGCGGDNDDDADHASEEGKDDLPDVDCDDDVPEYKDVALLEKCTTCHDSSKTGDERNEADDDVNFDTEAAAMKSAMKAAEEVYEGEMPPKSANITVTQAEKDALYKWALCSD